MLQTSFESEQVWEEEEEEEKTVEHELTLESLLERVGLADKIEIFHKEQIDLESLVSKYLHSVVFIVLLEHFSNRLM